MDWNVYYKRRIESDKRVSTCTMLDLHVRWYRNWLAYIEKHIHIFDTSFTSFEIGSGMGGVLKLLSSFGVPVTGSDVSSKAMHTFKAKYRTIPFIVYDVERAQVTEKKYDQVFAFEVLEHIKNPSIAITNIRNLLNRKGRFIGTTPYPYTFALDMPTHCSVHMPSYWRNQFKKAGFSSVETYPMAFPPYLWRIHPNLNIVFPFYVPFRSWLSTTLIIAHV